MPQCCARKRWFAIVLLISLIPIFSACSMAELESFAMENRLEEEEIQQRETRVIKDKSKILVLEKVIKGGKQKVDGAMGTFRRFMIGPDDEIKFIEPVGVGGVDNYLYIVDAGPKVVFRLDLAANILEPIGDVGNQFIGEPGNIFVAKDRTFYIADPEGKQVLHFNENGTVIKKLQDLANLARPMDMAVDEISGQILVADGSYSHLLYFDQFGKALRAIGGRGTGRGKFRAITAMSMGPEGVYVTDRLELPVQVISKEGEPKYAFGESHHVYPTAIAVTYDRLVFVADKSDNTIRIYRDAELLAVFGGTGSAPGRFREIASLWVDNDLLYAADRMNKRIQVMKILPENSRPEALKL